MYRPLLTKDAVRLRIIFAVVAIIVGIGYIFGSNTWHSSNLLHYVNLIPVPFYAWGLIFITAGILTLFERTKAIGYLLHVIILSFFDICMWLSFFYYGGSGYIGPSYIIAAIAVICVQLKGAVYDKVDPDRRI